MPAPGQKRLTSPSVVCLLSPAADMIREKSWISTIECPAHGDTEGDTQGDTHGDSVSPSCIPHLVCKFQRKYKALADRSATRINPDLPLGASAPRAPNLPLRAGFHFPTVQCSLSDRDTPSWLSAGCRFIRGTVEVEYILCGC
jgi:hypothetical protein